MPPRFVLVPAIPTAEGSHRVGNRYYAQSVSGSFDIYDNQEKVRLQHRFATRAIGLEACDRLNEDSFDPKLQLPFSRSE
jgi:hypothetical protein